MEVQQNLFLRANEGGIGLSWSIHTNSQANDSFIFSHNICRYDEIKNNCYDFALSFLNELLLMDMKPKLQKANFCKDFIVPWTTKAAHYIDLYRRIQQRGGISVEKIQRWNFYPLLVPNIFIWRNAWRLCEVCHQGFGVDARGILLFKNLISWWPVLAWSYPWHFMTRSWKGLRLSCCHAHAKSYNMLSIIYCGSYL